MKRFQILVISTFLYFSSGSNVWALGPVDGEIILSLWNNQYNSDLLDGELDVGSLTASGELWIGDNWGLRVARYESDLDDMVISNEQRTQFELRRRLLSFSDNNFVALGVGIEDIDLVNGENSSGLRVSAEARVAVTPLTYIYGRGGYLPDMDDAGSFRNMTGSEVEVGFSITPLPFVSVKFGYLSLNLDYDNTVTGTGGSSESDGFLIGAGLHW